MDIVVSVDSLPFAVVHCPSCSYMISLPWGSTEFYCCHCGLQEEIRLIRPDAGKLQSGE